MLKARVVAQTHDCRSVLCFATGDEAATVVAIRSVLAERLSLQPAPTWLGAAFEQRLAPTLQEAAQEAKRTDQPLCEYVFASVLVQRTTVTVSWIGDIRVYCLGIERTYHTHDHVAREGQNDDMPPGMYTRTVSAESSPEPDRQIWHPGHKFEVVLCSEEVHLHRDPAAHITELSEAIPPQPGLFLRLSCAVQ